MTAARPALPALPESRAMAVAEAIWMALDLAPRPGAVLLSSLVPRNRPMKCSRGGALPASWRLYGPWPWPTHRCRHTRRGSELLYNPTACCCKPPRARGGGGGGRRPLP